MLSLILFVFDIYSFWKCLFFYCLSIWDRVLLYSPGCPGAHIDPLAHTCKVLGLKGLCHCARPAFITFLPCTLTLSTSPTKLRYLFSFNYSYAYTYVYMSTVHCFHLVLLICIYVGGWQLGIFNLSGFCLWRRLALSFTCHSSRVGPSKILPIHVGISAGVIIM